MKEMVTVIDPHSKAVTDPLLAADLFKEHEETIELVITDYMMPHMTGIELLNILRTGNERLKGLVVTGRYVETDYPVLKKPFGMKMLREKGQELLGDV